MSLGRNGEHLNCFRKRFMMCKAQCQAGGAWRVLAALLFVILVELLVL